MTATATDALSLADQVWDRLSTITGVAVFDGEITDTNGNAIDPGTGKPVDPPFDDDGRAAAYAVFYPSLGIRYAMTQDAAADTLGWSFQVSCVGGDRTRCLWCAGEVREHLDGLTLTNANGQSLRLEEQGDSGAVLRDEDVEPARFMSPLRYAVTA